MLPLVHDSKNARTFSIVPSYYCAAVIIFIARMIAMWYVCKEND